MKQPNLFAVGALMSVIMPFFAVSCKTNNVLTDVDRVNAIASVLRSGTQLAVSATVLSRPETRVYFTSAAVAIDVVLGGKDLTPDTVVKIISEKVNTGGEYYSLIEGSINLALNAYKTFYTINVEKAIDPHLATLLKSIQGGIKAGTISSAPAPQGVNPITTLTEADLTL